MPNIQEIIRQIHRDLSCPICGKKFELKDIKLRGVFENTFIVQTVCQEGHANLLITIFNKKQQNINPISADDVLDLHGILLTFNGDFEKLWSKSS